jgi:uncharacterized membrane protein
MRHPASTPLPFQQELSRAAAVPDTAPSQRHAWVDVFRGLLIAHMALDHASLFFNAGRAGEEIAGLAAPVFTELWQFLARFTGVPVAPAFFFMAGFMVALTSLSRGERGVPREQVTRQLIVRGLVLIAVDALVMGLPRVLMGFYSFAVLSSIGVALILLALLRHLPSGLLLPAALAMMVLHPLLDVSALPVALRAVLHEPVRSGAFRSLYPVVPWCAVMLIGYVVGRDAARRTQVPLRLWWLLAALCLALFFALRLHGGYGNGYPTANITTQAFWLFAKYPPDLPFLAFALAGTFAGLATVRRLTKHGMPWLLQPLVVFGCVPFFFYVVHFYLLGIAAALLRSKFGLAQTLLIWLLLLVVMVPLCIAYARKKRERPNLLTRWF